ncbi:hypothetical protein Bbelb_048160 [Branchiostoma belcheri]|nr:hypothetical protein Bbelb_048160 [Branchiostoma belcheri]
MAASTTAVVSSSFPNMLYELKKGTIDLPTTGPKSGRQKNINYFTSFHVALRSQCGQENRAVFATGPAAPSFLARLFCWAAEDTVKPDRSRQTRVCGAKELSCVGPGALDERLKVKPLKQPVTEATTFPSVASCETLLSKQSWAVVE